MKKDRGTEGRKTYAAAVLTALALLTVPAVLTGCKEESLETSTEAAETESAAADETEPTSEEILDWKEATLTAEGSAERMVESGDSLFFRYRDAIYSINEKTDEMRALRVFEEGEQNGAFWVYKGGLYYDISYPAEASAQGFYGLYRMDLETGEEEHLADLMAKPTSMYASENTLYIRGFDMNIVYALDEDGKTKGELAPTETVYSLIPEGCRELFAGILPYYLEHCGYMPVQNDNCLVIAEADGSNPREVPEVTNTSSVLFAEDCFFALFSDGSGKTQCWRYEADTLEKEMVFESMANPQTVQYRDGILYYMENQNSSIVSSETVFYRVAADEGTAGTETPKQVLTVKKEPGMTGDYTYYGNFYAAEDHVYCQQFEDYGVYIGKKGFEEKEAALLEPVLYQSPIRKLGHVEGEFETIPCDCGDYIAAQIYTETLIFDGEGEAVEAMNQMLEDKRQRVLDSVYEDVKAIDDEEWIHHQSEFNPPYTLTFVIDGTNGITYLDDRYCCILTEGYEYTGGVHGMPFREYFVFDMESGERLTLAEIVENPVEELQQMVGTAFRKLAEETNFAFEAPEDLEFVVADSVSYESPFFLTEEGIAFYYTPYEIAPYAAGFPQVVIPYEKFDLKIELSNE